MNKIWKRVSSVLMMAVLCILMIPTVASATETKTDTSEMRLIYANVPSDWEAPCVWAWNDDGDSAFSAWPGEAMDVDSANEGWYYLYVPSWANHVIVNANAGEVQTDEMVLENGDAWITVESAESYEASTEKKTTGDIPEYTETFKIHAKVDASWENPGLWAWSAPDGANAFEAWPGLPMTKKDGDWYTAKAPTWVNSIIINANEGEVQTEDISVDPSEVWLIIAADGTYELSYVDPDMAAVENITVHVKAPADWDTPCLWAWSAPDGTNVYTTWPGEPLDAGDDWLTKEIPGWVNSVIVNGNNGEVQTSDLSVDAGKDIWIVVTSADEAAVYYEEPDASDVAEASETVEGNGEKSKLPIVGGVVGIAAVGGIAAAVVSKKKKSA